MNLPLPKSGNGVVCSFKPLSLRRGLFETRPREVEGFNDGDFNLALVIVAIVVCVLVFLFNIYLLVNYQHPDDANQAYFPKFVVVLGLSIAAISILMLPADVANRQACRHAIYNGACNFTLPMRDLWLAIYIVDAVLVFFVIPFAMFYYEGDQDKSVGKRIKSALLWVITTAIVCALVLGILYG
ncbi:LIMR family protein [Vitis vinifera]|uniref:LIMR family protein n=1 Tax=Vitis vinifera TaxID=29760 RepID=A0A438JAZ7_VITVI|nr:LIMR family protein [Vitis vinifera]